MMSNNNITLADSGNSLLISIVIPVYNAEKYLPDCLDSLIEQQFNSNEYEIICVDDGSPDNCINILNEYAEKYDVIKIIRQENSGVSAARCAGFNNSKGQYIWFVDSDDCVSSDSLQILKESIISNNFPDRINFYMYNFVAENCSTKDAIEKFDKSKGSNGEISLWNNIFKRKVLLDNRIPQRIKELGIKISEDHLFTIYYKCVELNCIYIDDILYYYRYNNNSVTHQQKTFKRQYYIAENYFIVVSEVKKLLDCYEEKHFKCKKSYLANVFMGRVWMIMELIACIPFKYRHIVIKKMKKEKIFPVEVPDSYDISKSDTLKWAYGHSKLEKYINCHSHSRLGFWAICAYYFPVRVKTFIKLRINKL